MVKRWSCWAGYNVTWRKAGGPLGCHILIKSKIHTRTISFRSVMLAPSMRVPVGNAHKWYKLLIELACLLTNNLPISWDRLQKTCKTVSIPTYDDIHVWGDNYNGVYAVLLQIKSQDKGASIDNDKETSSLGGSHFVYCTAAYYRSHHQLQPPITYEPWITSSARVIGPTGSPYDFMTLSSCHKPTWVYLEITWDNTAAGNLTLLPQ